MPPYGSTTRGPDLTRNSVATGVPAGSPPTRRAGLPAGQPREQRPRPPAGGVGVPDVLIGGERANQEACPVGRLAVDRVELVEPLRPRVHHAHAAAPRPVDVLAPLLAQVAPQDPLVGREVDHTGGQWLGR